MKKLFSWLLAVPVIIFVMGMSPKSFAVDNSYQDYRWGRDSAAWHIEIFGDFQCPYCAHFHGILTQSLVKRLVNIGKLQITFKDFPLEYHSHAKEAARAANAVLSIKPQQYLRMADLLFRNQTRWEKRADAYPVFLSFAMSLGLSQEQFETGYNDPANLSEINADIAEATQRGVDATPTYFINGTKYMGYVSLGFLMEYLRSSTQPSAPPTTTPGQNTPPAPPVGGNPTVPEPIVTGDGISRSSTTVTVLESRIRPQFENYTIEGMTLNFNTGPGFGLSTMKAVNIVANGQIVRSFPPGPSVVISGMNILAPKNIDTSVFIQLVLGEVGPAAGRSGEKVQVTITAASAFNSNGGKVSIPGFPITSNAITVYANIINLSANSLPVTILTSSPDQTIADISMNTEGPGRSGWYSLSMLINKSAHLGGLAATGCYVKDVISSSIISGTCTVASTDPLHPSASTIPDLATNGLLTFTATDEQSLPDTGKRYQIHLILTGASAAGDNLSTTLLNSSAGAAGTTASAVVATGASFVWSDESAVGHNLTTNDWYNDFGIRDLPLVFLLRN